MSPVCNCLSRTKTGSAAQTYSSISLVYENPGSSLRHKVASYLPDSSLYRILFIVLSPAFKAGLNYLEQAVNKQDKYRNMLYYKI